MFPSPPSLSRELTLSDPLFPACTPARRVTGRASFRGSCDRSHPPNNDNVLGLAPSQAGSTTRPLDRSFCYVTAAANYENSSRRSSTDDLVHESGFVADDGYFGPQDDAPKTAPRAPRKCLLSDSSRHHRREQQAEAPRLTLSVDDEAIWVDDESEFCVTRVDDAACCDAWWGAEDDGYVNGCITRRAAPTSVLTAAPSMLPTGTGRSPFWRHDPLQVALEGLTIRVEDGGLSVPRCHTGDPKSTRKNLQVEHSGRGEPATKRLQFDDDEGCESPFFVRGDHHATQLTSSDHASEQRAQVRRNRTTPGSRGAPNRRNQAQRRLRSESMDHSAGPKGRKTISTMCFPSTSPSVPCAAASKPIDRVGHNSEHENSEVLSPMRHRRRLEDCLRDDRHRLEVTVTTVNTEALQLEWHHNHPSR